jgi:hypothetical protein
VVSILITDYFLTKFSPKILLGFASSTKNRILRVSLKNIGSIIIICIVVSASFYSALYYTQNSPLEVNENVTIQNMGMQQAITWFDINAAEGSRIATNNYYVFPFFMSYLSSKNYSLIFLPSSQLSNIPADQELQAFVNLTSNKSIDYLIIFTNLGPMFPYPYLNNFVNNAPPGMYEVRNTVNFVIYKTISVISGVIWQASFSEGWGSGWVKDSRGSYQMASDGFETINGSLHMIGLSAMGDATPWAHWTAVGSALPSVNITQHPYLMLNFRLSSNTEFQVGLLIGEKIIYPINIYTPGNITTIVNLSEYASSGNVTNLVVHSRVMGENMPLNVYIDKIVFASSVL